MAKTQDLEMLTNNNNRIGILIVFIFLILFFRCENKTLKRNCQVELRAHVDFISNELPEDLCERIKLSEEDTIFSFVNEVNDYLRKSPIYDSIYARTIEISKNCNVSSNFRLNHGALIVKLLHQYSHGQNLDMDRAILFSYQVRKNEYLLNLAIDEESLLGKYQIGRQLYLNFEQNEIVAIELPLVNWPEGQVAVPAIISASYANDSGSYEWVTLKGKLLSKSKEIDGKDEVFPEGFKFSFKIRVTFSSCPDCMFIPRKILKGDIVTITLSRKGWQIED